MDDYLVLFFQIIITILLVIVPAVVLGLEKHYWLVGLVFVIVFYLIHCSLTVDVFNKLFTTGLGGNEGMLGDGADKRQFKLATGGVLVEDGVFGDVAENYYGTRIPIMGPYDGVKPADIQKSLGRQNYQKTAYPYRPLTHFNNPVPGNNNLSQSPDYQQEVERWYPDMTGGAMNARDCTNYPAGHPGSCLIGPDRIPASPIALPGLIGRSELIDEELIRKEEKFNDIASTPKLLKSGEPWPALFKNALSDVRFDTESLKPMPLGQETLCRTCKTGGCLKSYCGSRQLEPGNDNIISPAGYTADFLRSIALV